MALYSEKVMDHFTNPRNVGKIEDADGVGEVGNAKCGDIMKIYLKINDGIITDGTAGPREGTGIGRQTLQARAANIGATISIGADGDIYRITIQH